MVAQVRRKTMDECRCQREPCVCQQAQNLVDYANGRGVALTFERAIGYVVVVNAMPNMTHCEVESE